MNFSTKTRYALQMLVDMAVNEKESNVKVKDVAARQGISVKYLEQIIATLSKAGIVKGERGPQGGYRLSIDADKITAGMVYRLMEGSEKPTDDHPDAECPWVKMCIDIGLWAKVDEVVNEILDSTSIADLIDYARREQLMNMFDAPEYYI